MKTIIYLWSYIAQFFLRNVSSKICVENQNTHFIFIYFSPLEIVPFMRWCGKILYKQTGNVTMWHMHIAYWIHKATNTHAEYVICIVFPPPHCYMYIACIVFTAFSFKWNICHSVNFMSFILAILDFFTFIWHEDMRGSGDVTQNRLNLTTRWEWMTGFTVWLLSLCRKLPRYLLNRRLGGPQSWTGHFWEERNLLPLLGIELFLKCPICYLVTVQTGLLKC